MATVFKRFEIWILFVLIFSGIWWAFQAEPVAAVTVAEPSGVVATDVESEAKDEGLIEVKHVNLTSADNGSVVELTLFGKSGTNGPVALGASNLELLTSEGEDIHRFYLPFDPDPLLASDEKSLVTVKYWLKTPVDVLWLTYRDQTVKVEIPEASI